jgi:hypothetical protein
VGGLKMRKSAAVALCFLFLFIRDGKASVLIPLSNGGGSITIAGPFTTDPVSGLIEVFVPLSLDEIATIPLPPAPQEWAYDLDVQVGFAEFEPCANSSGFRCGLATRGLGFIGLPWALVDKDNPVITFSVTNELGFDVAPYFAIELDLPEGFSIAAVPEPSTWALLLIGFAGIGFMGYRKLGREKNFIAMPPQQHP